jgi:hypothetical protein
VKEEDDNDLARRRKPQTFTGYSAVDLETESGNSRTQGRCVTFFAGGPLFIFALKEKLQQPASFVHRFVLRQGFPEYGRNSEVHSHGRNAAREKVALRNHDEP